MAHIVLIGVSHREVEHLTLAVLRNELQAGVDPETPQPTRRSARQRYLPDRLDSNHLASARRVIKESVETGPEHWHLINQYTMLLPTTHCNMAQQQLTAMNIEIEEGELLGDDNFDIPDLIGNMELDKF